MMLIEQINLINFNKLKKYFVLLILYWACILFSANSFAATIIPSAPENYINDYAHILSANTSLELNQNLKQYEQQTSNQIVVAIFPGKLDIPIEDFSVKLEEKWKIGQKNKDNGVLLVIFPEDHQLRIEVGYGLEGAIPDALANTIIQQEIAPNFKAGYYDQGVSAGVSAIMEAAKGEYKPSQQQNIFRGLLPFIIFIVVFLLIRVFTKYGRNSSGRGGWGGGSSGNDDSFGGGFGGGGGGSSGGGGASGRW